MRANAENSGVLIGATVAGAGILIGGVIGEFAIAIAVGGAILGSSLSGWLSKKDILRVEQNTLAVLEKTLTSKFRSKEENLINYRKEWHIYHVSEINKETVWRHHHFDFSCNHSVGSLNCEVKSSDKNGDQSSYFVEGGVRDSRLIIFEKAKGSEEPVGIYILPLFCEAFHTTHHGFGIIKSWDGNSILSPVIMSRKPLPDIKSQETLGKEDGQKLDIVWEGEFTRLHKVFPKINA